MTISAYPHIPKALRAVAVETHGFNHLDLYVDPALQGKERDALGLHLKAEQFGYVMDEQAYLRLRISPVFNFAEVVEYFEAAFPPYESDAEPDVKLRLYVYHPAEESNIEVARIHLGSSFPPAALSAQLVLEFYPPRLGGALHLECGGDALALLGEYADVIEEIAALDIGNLTPDSVIAALEANGFSDADPPPDAEPLPEPEPEAADDAR